MPAPVLTRLTTVPPLSVIGEAIVNAAPAFCWWTKSSLPLEVRLPPVRPEVAVATVGVTRIAPDCSVVAPAKVRVTFAAELKRRALAVTPAATLAEASTSTFVPAVKAVP